MGRGGYSMVGEDVIGLQPLGALHKMAAKWGGFWAFLGQSSDATRRNPYDIPKKSLTSPHSLAYKPKQCPDFVGLLGWTPELQFLIFARKSLAKAVNMAEIREVMDIREASEYLGVSRETLYKYIYEEKIPAFKLGNRWKFKKTVLDRWMERQSTQREERVGRKGRIAAR